MKENDHKLRRCLLITFLLVLLATTAVWAGKQRERMSPPIPPIERTASQAGSG